jgi:hypothetical protein
MEVLFCKSFIVLVLYSITFHFMITALEASKLLKEMSPLEKAKVLVGEKLEKILDQTIELAIRKNKTQIELILSSSDPETKDIPTPSDKDIKEALLLLGYESVKVESQGRSCLDDGPIVTSIGFSIPQS